jgi:hypothetical protein
MGILEILLAVNSLAIVFGAGALWQRVRGNGQRLDRIESMLNGWLNEHPD